MRRPLFLAVKTAKNKRLPSDSLFEFVLLKELLLNFDY